MLVFLFVSPGSALDSGIKKQLEELHQKLNLNDQQTHRVEKILQKEEIQKQAHRKAYEKDALALIRAAWERRNNTNSKIKFLLDKAQLEDFKNIEKMHPVDRELFQLTEGLLLNSDQAFDVEGILIKFYNEFGRMGEMINQGGEMPIDPPSNGERGMGMSMGRRRGIGGMMKAKEAKKAKAIKKILSPQQKELYEQIREDRKEKYKQWIKEMKQNFREKGL